MNELLLQEMNQERVIYLYKPEGKGESGEIIYFFAKNQAQVVKQSKDDEFGRYANKALLKIEECVSKNNLPIKLVQAWY
jgi:hypothetical protein